MDLEGFLEKFKSYSWWDHETNEEVAAAEAGVDGTL